MLLLLTMLLGAGYEVPVDRLPVSDPGPIYVPGEHEGGTGQTRCHRASGIIVMCPGVMSEECCCRWVSSARKPACAGGDAGVPVS